MSFAARVWRLLVGIKDALVLLFLLLFFAGLYGLLSASPYKESARSGALLLDLDGAIVEQPARPDAIAALSGRAQGRQYRVAELVRALDAAASDNRIKAVARDLDSVAGGGQSAIADVGAALDRVRRAGKPVIAWSNGYTDDGYQLAAHASEVWLDPLGAVAITGPGGSNLYYAGLLQRLGITANVYRVGAYKLAVEPFTRNDMSPEARTAAQALADALWESWRQDVAQARPRARIADWVADPHRFIAEANGDLAEAARRAGLVDRIGDRTAFGARVAEVAGTSDDGLPGSFRAVRYDAWVADHPISDSAGRIGVLTIAGEIVDGHAGPGTAGAETIVANLERGLRNGNLKALVVRVDSPGGSVFGSERIRRAIAAAHERGLPVVISMGSVAASGGYWVSTAGDAIFAEPSTITGSIGVFGILPSFQGALEKLGIGVDGVRTTPLSGEPDLLRGPSEEAGRLIQAGVENTYRRFIALVSSSRRLPPARVNAIGQGRVWDGGTARQFGLVDRFGRLEDAIAEAARRANLDPNNVRTVYLERQSGWFEKMLLGLSRRDGDDDAEARDAFSRIASRQQALVGRALGDARSLLAGPAIQARCLECASATAPPPAAGRRATPTLLGALLARLWDA
jgi:protease-4